MADAAVEFLLQNVKELLVYNVELLGDVKKEVEALRDDLEVFQGFLEDSADYHGGSNHNEQQAIVRKIRSIVNRAEDAIDNFVVEKSRNADRNVFSRAAHMVDHLTSVRGIAGEVRSIRSSVDKINAQKGSSARFSDRDLRGNEFEVENR
ncbi:hypothetical protein Leryth_004523 [Lithospermum erythrorhizon]|nr:hypothetical protein Leryth_004523 [Lithospermum erythrorhizon]